MKTSSFFQRYKEIVLGVFMVALAAFYLYFSSKITIRSTVSVSARLIPEILGGIVLVLGVLQLVSGIRFLGELNADNRAEGKRNVALSEGEKRNIVPYILTFALIIGYALVFEWLGFIVASTLCMFCQMLILSPRSKLRPLFFLVISLVSAVVVYIAFRKGLDLSLPQGILEGLPL